MPFFGKGTARQRGGIFVSGRANLAWLDSDNLVLADIDWNPYKGLNLTGIDPDTNKVTELFHLRRQQWNDHFAWKGIIVVGQTAVGRTTARVLEMNSDDQLEPRSSGRPS